ncbi:fimbrial protein [Serratia marcescens]
MKYRKRINTLFTLPLIFFGCQSFAAEEVTINLRGGLIAPPPCVINDGGKIDVDFGEGIGINKLDGRNYRQEITYRITCEPSIHSWTMTLTLKGSASFDNATLQTSNVNLGIRLYQNNTPFIINKTINIDPTAPPILAALPIGRPGVILSEGEFIATATLQADYL